MFNKKLLMMLDVWSYIATFIERDKDRCRLMMTATEMMNCQIYFSEKRDIDEIIGLKLFDKFTNVIINNHKKLPQNTTHLSLSFKFDYLAKNYIPSTVTHLYCKNTNVLSMDNCVPSTVTHLIFNHYLTAEYFNNFQIPSSITHLKVGFHHGTRYYESFNCQVPISVIQITINGFYDNKEKTNLTNGFSNGITKIVFSNRHWK